MASVEPYAGVEAHALSAKYMGRVEPRNTLAAPAPATRHTPRPAPQSELRAVLRSTAAAGLLASDAAVLAALWSHVDAHGTAWPSISTLAKISHASTRTVLRSLKRLEGAGIVARHASALRARRRFHESNTYAVARAAALPQAPRADQPRRPRRVAASPSPSTPEAPAVEPVRVEPVALPVAPSPSSPAAPHQVTPWRSKDPTQNRKENARAGAQVREAPALPGDRLGPPAVAQSVPEAPPAKITSAEPSPPEAPPVPRLTRAERSARNRAAWSKRTRPSATAARVAAPRRAMPYRAPVEQVPDTGPALAALREWRSTLPGIGRETDRESATPAPVPGVRRPDLAQRAPVALQRLLEAFARVPVGQHGGQHGETPAPPDGARHLGAGLDSQTRSQQSGATAPSSPRVEARSAPLLCPHPRRW